MSCDFAVWSSKLVLNHKEAGELYVRLCGGASEDLPADPAVDAFYVELTSEHPEIDDIPEEQLDDKDYCPWSCAMDRTDSHVIMCCVWSKAGQIGKLVEALAMKHGLAFYDPQAELVKYPQAPASKPWWRPW